MVRILVALLISAWLLVLVRSAEAQVGIDPPGRSTMEASVRPSTGLENLATRIHGEKTTPVPPTLEIELLDPNADPLGNPAVLTRSEDGKVVVDIPPAVLVHRYYYTGDRSFQGPMLPGGPSIVVVNHPGTGERIYLEIQMLPGAPKVTYSRHSIVYDYGPQAITISFGLHGRPKVTYREGTPLATRARQATLTATRATGDIVRRTGAPEVGRKLALGTKNIVETTADRTRDVGRAVASPFVQAVRATPLSGLVTSSLEDRSSRERDALTRRAEAESAKLEATIKTVR